MKKINKELFQIILELKKDWNNFTPNNTDTEKSYNTKRFKNLIVVVNNDMDNVLLKIKEILYSEILENIVIKFEKIIKFSLANQLDWVVINKSLLKCLGFSVVKNEIDEALKSPIKYIKSKINYKNDEEIQKLFNLKLSCFDYSQNNNTNYTSDKMAFIISVILLDNEIKKICNPIEDISNDYSQLEKHYKLKGIKLDKQNYRQFSKYKLIYIRDDFELRGLYPPRLYDSKCKSTIFLNGVEDYVFEFLLKLRSKHKFNLSLKPSSLFFINGKYNEGGLLESLETGEYFDISKFKQIPVTKLYNKNYDTLWIKIDSFNLTFEEVLQDYDCYKGMIVTQVVHSEYVIEKDKFFITHLDHEFIFYTDNEYKKRQSDPEQHGKAMERIKTFKIDKSKIPITNDDNVLLTILQMKFKNQKLLEEYFNKVDS